MAKSDKTEHQEGEEKTTEPPFEKPSLCLLCGQIGPTLLYGHWICDHCKNMVQAEAMGKTRKIIKEGGGPPGEW